MMFEHKATIFVHSRGANHEKTRLGVGVAVVSRRGLSALRRKPYRSGRRGPSERCCHSRFCVFRVRRPRVSWACR